MPTLGPLVAPSSNGGGLNLSSGGGGGGVFGPGATSSGPTGTFTAYVAPAPSASYSSGSGSASSIAASIAQGGVPGGSGIESAFYDQRLAEIYYLGDKPWYDETRYDEFGFTTRQPNNNLRTALILAAVLLLAKQL